jgi:hypothetical protein
VDVMDEITLALAKRAVPVYLWTIMVLVLKHLVHVRIQQIVVQVNFVQSQWENVIRPEHVYQSKHSVQIFLIQCVDVMDEITPALVGLVLLVYQSTILDIVLVLVLVLVLVVHLDRVMIQQIVIKVNFVQRQSENVIRPEHVQQSK